MNTNETPIPTQATKPHPHTLPLPKGGGERGVTGFSLKFSLSILPLPKGWGERENTYSPPPLSGNYPSLSSPPYQGGECVGVKGEENNMSIKERR